MLVILLCVELVSVQVIVLCVFGWLGVVVGFFELLCVVCVEGWYLIVLFGIGEFDVELVVVFIVVLDV